MLENGAAELRTAHSTADSNIATNHSIPVVLWLPPLLLLQLLFLAKAQLTVSSRLLTEAWPFVRWKQRRSAIWKTSSSGVGETNVWFSTRVSDCAGRLSHPVEHKVWTAWSFTVVAFPFVFEDVKSSSSRLFVCLRKGHRHVKIYYTRSTT